MKFASQTAAEVVVLTTSSAATDEHFMQITFPSRCSHNFYQRLTLFNTKCDYKRVYFFITVYSKYVNKGVHLIPVFMMHRFMYLPVCTMMKCFSRLYNGMRKNELKTVISVSRQLLIHRPDSGHHNWRPFSGDGYYCLEDNCNTQNLCDINAQCVYETYSQRYICRCNPGFEGDGRYCRQQGKHREMGYVTLVAFAGTTVLVSCHVVKPLQPFWRSGTRRWSLRVPDLQLWLDLNMWFQDISSGNGHHWGWHALKLEKPVVTTTSG